MVGPGKSVSRTLKGKKIRVINDLRVKSVRIANLAGSGTLIGGRRVHCIAGVSTRKYYDSSSKRYNIFPINMDTLVSLTHLAMCLYNIKNKHTNFGQVKVIKVIRSLGASCIDYRITFEAFSSLGDDADASVFITKITRYFQKVEIRSVKIKCDNGKNSQEVPPPNIPKQRFIKTLSSKSLKDMAPYLSQCALALYNIFTLRVKKDAVHAIPSLKVVKAMKHDDAKEGTTYLVTFKASLREHRKNVETFETQICVPTLFPTTTFDFKEIKMIKHN